MSLRKKANRIWIAVILTATLLFFTGCDIIPRDSNFPKEIKMPKGGGTVEVNLDFTRFHTADPDLPMSEIFIIHDLDTVYRSSWLSVKVNRLKHTLFTAEPNTTGKTRKIVLLHRGPDLTYVDIIQN